MKCKYCGKECKSKLSKSCHERLCKLNPNKKDTTYLTENALQTNKLLSEKHNKYKSSLKIIRFTCTCESCGNQFYIDDYENRKYFPKCCSDKCAHKLSTINDNKNETKNAKCIICGKDITINKRASDKTCKCNDCKHPQKIKKKHIKKHLLVNKSKQHKQRKITEETIQKLREAGKKSAAIQSQNRRSKNEMKFCNLCESYFLNVKHNEPIFNGWDADVILPDIKFAVLWNGKVHYEPIFGNANYNRVTNRDKIKLKEIERAGYNYYIIKDIGKHNDNFANKKFNEFIEYLKENNYI